MSLRFALLLGVASALVAFAIGTQFAPSRTSERLPSRLYAPAAATELAGEAGAIQAVLLEEDLLARTADLTALLQRLGPDSLEDVKDAYETIFIDFGETDLVFLAEWWARFDPKAAFEWTQEQLASQHPMVVQAVFRTWAHSDPDAAMAAAQVPNRKLRNMYVEACLVGWAEADPSALLEYARKLTPSGDRQRILYVVARRKVLRDGPAAAFEWADQLADGDQAFKFGLLRRIASSAAVADPVRAASWAETLLGGHYARGVPQQVATRWAQREPVAAMAWLETLPEGKNRENAVRETFRLWMREDPDAAIRYASNLEIEPWLDPVAARLARWYEEENVLLALDWASKVNREERRLATTAAVARNWATRDEPAARAWVDQAGLPDHLVRKIFDVPAHLKPGASFERREEKERAEREAVEPPNFPDP